MIGSSNRMNCGCLATSRATDTFWRVPLSSFETSRLALADRPNSWIASSTRRVRSALGELHRLQRQLDVAVDADAAVDDRVLEDHADVALARREAGNVLVAEIDRARGLRLQTGDDPHQRRLAATGRPEETGDLPAREGERDIVHRVRASRRSWSAARREFQTWRTTESGDERLVATGGVGGREASTAPDPFASRGVEQGRLWGKIETVTS